MKCFRVDVFVVLATTIAATMATNAAKVMAGAATVVAVHAPPNTGGPNCALSPKACPWPF